MRTRTNSVYLLLITSVVMVIVSAGITYYSTLEKRETIQSLIRNYQVIQSSTQLFSILKDMETGQRGYLLTGDSLFLEPFEEGTFDLESEKDTLRNLIGENTRQAIFLEGQILQVVNRKYNDLQNSLSIYKKYGSDSAVRRISTRVGKAHMDTLRLLVQDLVQRERLLLSQQEERLEANTEMEDSIRFYSFALIGLTSLVALITIIRKQRSNTELLERLQKANEELEHKVHERTRQLVEANQAKDHFLGIASHDLKVPISGIQGLVELMQLNEPKRSAPDAEYLSYMQESCNAMQRLISNLLDINRIERHITAVVKQPVELGPLLAKLEREFSYPCKKKSIGLIIDKTEETIQTDPDALSRILENLLSNAIKFSSIGKEVHLRITHDDGHIRFEVIDQGPGIPAEDMPKLFGKFQKLTNRPTAGEGSTGLGLSIVKELTGLLGGEISAANGSAGGTVFTVTINR